MKKACTFRHVVLISETLKAIKRWHKKYRNYKLHCYLSGWVSDEGYYLNFSIRSVFKYLPLVACFGIFIPSFNSVYFFFIVLVQIMTYEIAALAKRNYYFSFLNSHAEFNYFLRRLLFVLIFPTSFKRRISKYHNPSEKKKELKKN